MNTIYLLSDKEKDSIAKFMAMEDPQAVNEFCEDIDSILNGNEVENFFIFMGKGAFKNCYSIPNINGFIVKFATISNHTEKEIKIYNSAKEKDLDAFFCDSMFIKITSPFVLPRVVFHEDYEDDSSCDCCCCIYTPTERNSNDQEYEYIIIQRVVEVASNDDSYNIDTLITSKDYFEDANIADTRILNYLEQREDDFIIWLYSATKFYGMEKVLKFLDFCIEEDISDLRKFNFGEEHRIYECDSTICEEYAPVIFDWLS